MNDNWVKIPSDLWRLVSDRLGPTKAFKWFRIKHPMLGDVSPLEMLERGRENRLRKAISSMLN